MAAWSATTIASDLDEFPKLIGLVDAFCDAHRIEPTLRYHLHLVVEELAANAIRHGYKGEPSGWVRVRLRKHRDGAVVEIEDGAPRFDPFRDAPRPDTRADLDARGVGGLGVHLVRDVAERYAYARVAGDDGRGANRVTVRLKGDTPRLPQRPRFLSWFFSRNPQN